MKPDRFWTLVRLRGVLRWFYVALVGSSVGILLGALLNLFTSGHK